jgi:ribonuclease E
MQQRPSAIRLSSMRALRRSRWTEIEASPPRLWLHAMGRRMHLMSKQLIINAAAAEEVRVAIIENDQLVDLDIENQARTKHKGNIYKGIVANVEDSLEAAFIEFGDDKQAFLALSEVRPSLYPEHLKGQRRPKISDVLKRGQEVVVQVTKDEMGNKGAAVTTYLSLPGRYVVLMHSDESGGGVSRKVEDESARRRARDVLAHINVPDGQAVIIRTAGVSRPRLDLYRDLKSLARQWEQIDRGATLGRAPTLLYREPDLVVRTIRDYLSPEISKVVIDAEEEFEELKSYFEERSPEAVQLLELHQNRQPIFDKYRIEEQIEDLFEREVKLPSGGYLVIDQAEALVAIDVNSGKSNKESDHEATVYKTNMEAAKEVARQLRLRDMGGIIVVDFIDMVNRRHDRDVERVLREVMKEDKARVKIGRISENGTLEITRQRLRQAHRLISHVPCVHCNGTGIIRDPRGLALRAFRELNHRVSKGAGALARITMRAPLEVANLINNSKRRELMDLGDEHKILIDIVGDARLQGKELKFEDERRGRAGLEAAGSVRDPRLQDHGRRGSRRGRRDAEPAPNFGPTTPPPSIGPVPEFLDDEAAIAAADERDAQEQTTERDDGEGGDEAGEAREARSERAPRADRDRGGDRDRDRGPREPKAAVDASPVHFDDPLTEALLGSAPDIALQDVLVAQADTPAAEGEVRKKRRRRRRRRGGAAAAGADGAAGENSESSEADDAGDDEADEVEAEQAPAESAATAESQSTPPIETDDAEASDAEATETGDVDTAKRKAPRRRRPRKDASKADAPADAAAPDATASEGADEADR